jgi:hypothetical protein
LRSLDTEIGEDESPALPRDSADSGTDKTGISRTFEEHDPSELIGKARSYLEEGDHYSAYYFANLAANTAAENGTEWREARRLASEIREKLEQLELNAEESELQELYRKKREALARLSSGDPTLMIQAYHEFRALAASYPLDGEAVRYFSESRAAIAGFSFFLPDAEMAMSLPGLQNVVFINTPAEADRLELVTVGKIVASERGVFVGDIEVLGIESSRDVAYHLQAPLGQILGSTIIMRGIDPENPESVTEATNLSENSSGSPSQIIEIRPTFDELTKIARASQPLASSNFLELRSMSRALATYGYRSEPVQHASLLRVIRPFHFFILSILAAAFGWRLRSVGGPPPVVSFLLLPVFPFVLYYVVEVYEYAHRLVFGAILLSVGYVATLFLVLAIESALLFGAVFVLAGLSSDAPAA